MYDLAVRIETVDVTDYEADMDLGTYIKDDVPRTYYQVDDIVFAVHYPDDDFFKHLHPVYEYLYVGKSDAKTMVSVDFVNCGDLWEIHWNNMPVEMAIPKLSWQPICKRR